MHYTRWYEHGDPTVCLTAPNGAVLAYVLENYLKPVAHEPWPFSCDGHGRSQMWYQGKLNRSAVISCTLAHGPRPQGLVAAHSCRNLTCFWATHLSWKTQAENLGDDRRRDGTLLRGEQLHQSKLTADLVVKMRAAHARGDITYKALGDLYGVGSSAAFNVVNRKTWRHVS
jgi:hypothetical protein